MSLDKVDPYKFLFSGGRVAGLPRLNPLTPQMADTARQVARAGPKNKLQQLIDPLYRLRLLQGVFAKVLFQMFCGGFPL